MARCARLAHDRRDAQARLRRPHRGGPGPSARDTVTTAVYRGPHAYRAPFRARLQHLFRDQVGVPIRRYLLWHRYLTALSLLADGASVTHAAHAAGFADSAHLTRTAVRLNGFTPTKMPFRMWLTNCR